MLTSFQGDGGAAVFARHALVSAFDLHRWMPSAGDISRCASPHSTRAFSSLHSFIGREAGKALFIGFYSIGPSKPLTVEEYWQVPANIEMKAFGMKGFNPETDGPIIYPVVRSGASPLLPWVEWQTHCELASARAVVVASSASQ
jgi:hypothetical protein